jgi:hypothetical protein
MSKLSIILTGIAIDSAETTLLERLRMSELASVDIQIMMLEMLRDALTSSSDMIGLASTLQERIAQL